jgi:uncharacterized protein (TIRG00374 family)
MNHRSRLHGLLVLAVKIGFAALLFWIIFSNVNFAGIKERVYQLSTFGCALITMIFAAHAVLSVVRWRAIIVHLGGSVGLCTIISGSLIERFVNQALPAIVGGDGARIIELVKGGEKTMIAAYSVFVDRLFSLAGAFGLVLALLPLSSFIVTAGSPRVFLILVSTVSLLAIAVLLIPPGSFWTKFDGNRVVSFVSRVATTLREFSLTPRLAMLTIGSSLIMQALFVACFLVLSYDLKIDLRVKDAVALIPLVMLASLVPISLAGWGVREVAAAVLLPMAGVPASDAVALSLVFGIAYLATSCLGGAVWLIIHVVGRRDGRGGSRKDESQAARSDSRIA